MNKKAENILKIQLKTLTIEDLGFWKPKKVLCNVDYEKVVHVFVERIKGEMICLRYFCFNPIKSELSEVARLYADKKDKYFYIKDLESKEFCLADCEEKYWFLCSTKTIFDKDSSFKGTILDYYKNILSQFEDYRHSLILWALICIPSAELFFKQGLEYYIIKFLDNNIFADFKEFLKEECGYFDLSKKSAKAILGINDFQIKIINSIEKQMYKPLQCNNTFYESVPILKFTKNILGKDDISSLSDTQSEKLLSFLSLDSDKMPMYDILFLLTKLYSITVFSFIDKLMHLYERGSYFTICDYRDSLKMIDDMEASDIFDPHFETAAEITHLHYLTTEVYNERKSFFESKKIEKRADTWKKFEYADSDFSVVAPKTADDIAKEGITLHHCATSYIERVADGKTNIVFIRKNTSLEKPFFTVEITNYNTIQQVHGFGNRNADTEPGLTEFVEKWAASKHLLLNNINQIR